MGRKLDKPALAQWIAHNRHRLDLKPEGLADALRALGYEVQAATIRGWEAGARPSDSAITRLERLFEAPAPTETSGTASTAAIVEAIERQTEAMQQQADAIRDHARAMERVLAALALLVNGGDAAEAGRDLLQALLETEGSPVGDDSEQAAVNGR